MDYKSDNTEFEAWAKSEQLDIQRALVWGTWTYFDSRTAAAWLAWQHLKPIKEDIWMYGMPTKSGIYLVQYDSCHVSIGYYCEYNEKWDTYQNPIKWKYIK